jgi:hypothetical protein
MVNLSTGAAFFLVVESVFFCFLLYAIYRAKLKLSGQLMNLSKSLRLSEDLFGDDRSFVTSARTRYRRAAERIEDVDAHAIASGELSSYEVISIWKWRMNIGSLDELISSAPGVFVTIGLLGTFVGLVLNLGELSAILDSGEANSSVSPGNLVERLGGVLAPMSTAFVSSLGGVFFSLLFWIVGLVVGANRILDETETLLTAYLEQVVQADCNRFSLMRASVERMELCLAEFMSKFSERVGNAIDQAMSRKICEVFEAIKKGTDSLESYAQAFDQGAKELQISGNAFYAAASLFSQSTFATDFASAVENFYNTSLQLTDSAGDLSIRLNALTERSDLIEKGWDETRVAIQLNGQMSRNLLKSTEQYTNSMVNALSELNESSKQLRSARLAIGKENKQSDELARALLKELKDSQPYREDIMKTIQILSSQLQNRTTIDSKLNSLIESNLRVEGLNSSEKSKLNLLLDTLLKANVDS